MSLVQPGNEYRIVSEYLHIKLMKYFTKMEVTHIKLSEMFM